MDDEARSWYYSAPLATLLLCGAAAIFLLGFVPEARKAKECEALVIQAERRLIELNRQEEATRRRIAELQAGSGPAVEEAIREVLRLGEANDFLPAPSGRRPPPSPGRYELHPRLEGMPTYPR